MMRARDVVIVGAGVIGSSIAYHLSRVGADVALVDRDDVASGTSSACDGHVLSVDKEPGYDSHLARLSGFLLRNLVPDLPCDVQYHNWGSVLAVERDEDMQTAQRFVQRKSNDGTSVRIMDRGEMRADAPNLAPDLAGGVLCQSDSVVNPMALAFAFAQGARQHGAKLLPFTRVTDIDLQDGAVCGVSTDRGHIPTGTAVCAAGVWTADIIEKMGVDLPITPRKGHVLVAEQDRLPYWRNMLEFGYLMAKRGLERDVEPAMEKYGVAFVYERTASGNFLIGSSREFAGFDPQVDPDVIRLMARRAVRFFPCIADAHMIRSYTGFRPYTPDHRPIVSGVDGVPGLYIASGHEGNGISLAAATGHLVTDMLLGREPAVDMSPLSLARFTAG